MFATASRKHGGSSGHKEDGNRVGTPSPERADPELVEWDAWRIHLGCPDLRIRVYDTGAEVRRTSVAEVVIDQCRVAVELVEEVGVDDIDHLLAGHPHIDRAPRYPDER